MSKNKEKLIPVSRDERQYLQRKAGEMSDHDLAKKMKREFDSDLRPKDIARLRMQLQLPPEPANKKKLQIDPRLSFVAERINLSNDDLAGKIQSEFAVKTKPKDVEELRKEIKKRGIPTRKYNAEAGTETGGKPAGRQEAFRAAVDNITPISGRAKPEATPARTPTAGAFDDAAISRGTKKPAADPVVGLGRGLHRDLKN